MSQPIDLLLREAFNAPASQADWEVELLGALGCEELPLRQRVGMMRLLWPLMGELLVKPSGAAIMPWPEQEEDEASRGCRERGERAYPDFELRLNSHDEVILVVGDNWPVVLGTKEVVRDQLIQFAMGLTKS